MLLIEKSDNKNTDRYRPKVLITSRIKPRVMRFMGNKRIFIIGFRNNSNRVMMTATLIRVSVPL